VLKAGSEKRILAFCGIARPERFAALLKKEGIHPVETLTFPDHHSYSRRSIARIKDLLAKSGVDAAVTTEKDAVKLGTIQACRELPLYYLKIALEADPEFFAYMHSRIGSLTCA
jgi:tetraacyldisaccharide-1-P 4'-kinase